MAKKVGRKTKDDWLQTALGVLETEGIARVTVERLARELAISKSGFYWHFKDRAHLLQHLLDYWAREYTGVVADNKLVRRLEPRQRIEQIMEMIHDYDLDKLDLPMRTWGRRDSAIQPQVDKVTEARLDFLRAAFRELGFEGDDLEMRARLFVCYHIWERTTFGELPERKRRKLQKLRLELLTK